MNRQQELDSLGREFESREAGVAELMELYEKLEGIYAAASESLAEEQPSHTTDSTNAVSHSAYMG